MEKQVRCSFDRVTIKKVLKGAGIAGSAAILTYMAQNLSELNFGASTGIVVAILSILINMGREYLKGAKK